MGDRKSVEAASLLDMATRKWIPEPASPADRNQETPGQPKVPPVAPATPVEPSPAFRPYRVLLDPETRRLFTEVIDTRTGDVLLRIPPGYVPPEEGVDYMGSERREVEL